MKKILIIENEFASIKDSIDALMEMFQGLLHYDLVAVSQDIKWSEIEQYSAIFVDVSLSPRTELDGYGILNRIKERYPSILSRLVIAKHSKPMNRKSNIFIILLLIFISQFKHIFYKSISFFWIFISSY